MALIGGLPGQLIKDKETQLNFDFFKKVINEYSDGSDVTHSSLTAADAAEAATRASADSTLTTNLATEVTNRTNADTALDGRLDVVELILALVDKISFGTGTTVWTGTATSNALTIAHGLGGTPTAVLVTANADLSAAGVPAFGVYTVGSTNFTVKGQAAAALGPGNVPIFWLAIR